MGMIDVHSSSCPQCKMRAQFYEKFSSDSKKNVSYFGVISYVNNYYVMPVSSDEPKKEFSKDSQKDMGSNICFLQLINQWSIRDLISKRIKENNGLLSRHSNEIKKKKCPKPPFYQPEHTGNFICIKKPKPVYENLESKHTNKTEPEPTKKSESFTIKKSESFTESSPEDTVCSNNLETTKIVYKCKSPKKSPSKQFSSPLSTSPSKEKVAPKEPRVGTLKRKRWNLEKLKPNETYEDDLFAEKKLKRIPVDDSNSEEDKIKTPVWSVQISPCELSRSPSYEDCYSLTDLQNSRKEAEEYQFRRKKWKKSTSIGDKNDPEAVMKKDPVTYETLVGVTTELEKQCAKTYESDEDYYFNDAEDS